jgi:hypothetical protein
MIAVAIRTGCHITGIQKCINCPDIVQPDGIHGLSCQKGVHGRAKRHIDLNLWLEKTLKCIGWGSRLEPEYLWNGKRPDGVTTTPWKNGLRLAWDASVSDNFASTYRKQAMTGSGKVADTAEQRKLKQYEGINNFCLFQPLVFETLGSPGTLTESFLNYLGKVLINKSGDPRAASFMKQKLSVDLQKNLCSSVIESIQSLNADIKEWDFMDIMDLKEEDQDPTEDS